jgi:two-component system response regulator FixJ
MQSTHAIHFAGVDDSLTRFLTRIAPSIGATLEAYVDLEQFLELHQRNPPECLVLIADATTPSSENVLSSLQNYSGRLPVIVAGDATHSGLEDQLFDAGLLAFVPVEDFPLIRAAVTASLELSREQEQIRVRMRDFKRRLGNLSVKQVSVLDALARGGSNKQIASEFGVSERTLERRRAELISALDVRSVIEAAWWYGRSSLPEPGQRFRWPPLELIAATVEDDCESDGGKVSPAVLASAGPIQ